MAPCAPSSAASSPATARPSTRARRHHLRLGTEELYEFLDNNPLIEAHPVEPRQRSVRRLPKRQHGRHQLGDRGRSDRPGLLRLHRVRTSTRASGGRWTSSAGAARSKGGRPIIALPATAKAGKLSRIVPYLKQGAGVVTSRADVHYVVTEHGVANLFGKNLRERAEALIAIAAPQFQDELEEAAKKRKLLP